MDLQRSAFFIQKKGVPDVPSMPLKFGKVKSRWVNSKRLGEVSSSRCLHIRPWTSCDSGLAEAAQEDTHCLAGSQETKQEVGEEG